LKINGRCKGRAVSGVYSIPLILVFILSPIPYCPDDYRFILFLEIA
jgi:hypothetical protein